MISCLAMSISRKAKHILLNSNCPVQMRRRERKTHLRSVHQYSPWSRDVHGRSLRHRKRGKTEEGVWEVVSKKTIHYFIEFLDSLYAHYLSCVVNNVCIGDVSFFFLSFFLSFLLEF